MNKLTTIIPISLALFAGSVVADEFIYHGFQGSGAFGNQDLAASQYPTTLALPAPSLHSVHVSLYAFQAGNPDGYQGEIPGYQPISNSVPTITSLDIFQKGSPETDGIVDYSLPVIGSDEALAAAHESRKGGV